MQFVILKSPLHASVANKKRSGKSSWVVVNTLAGIRLFLYQWTPIPDTYLLASGSPIT